MGRPKVTARAAGPVVVLASFPKKGTSMPCMPARRDMQTGRLSFLHRSWGPLEPFDNSFPELMKTAGAYSHLISDHYHYWEDGGATYHTRYNSFEFIRGQESDPWKVMRASPIDRIREKYHRSQNDPNTKQNPYNYMINREFIKEEKDFPSVQCFEKAFEFLDLNRDADNMLLQVETFDPHEPFFAPERFRAPFKTDYEGPILDWPRYERVTEPQEEIDELRANYFALLSLCDALLGALGLFFFQSRHLLFCQFTFYMEIIPLNVAVGMFLAQLNGVDFIAFCGKLFEFRLFFADAQRVIPRCDFGEVVIAIIFRANTFDYFTFFIHQFEQ